MKRIAAVVTAMLVGSLALVGPAGPAQAKPQPGPINAGNTFGWYPVSEVYDWEFGEGLEGWQDWADGTGRASIYTAMLTLDSGPMGKNADNFGSVAATLTKPGHVTGRWEARMRSPEFGSTGHTHYNSRLELVPSGTAPGQGCPASRVTMAAYTGYSSDTELSANTPAGNWSFNKKGVKKNRTNWHTYGVEVRKNQITWFVDAKVTAVLKTKAAVPGVALVPRLVLLGTPGVQMVHARATTDWIRYFPLNKHKTPKKQLKRAAKVKPVAAPGATLC